MANAECCGTCESALYDKVNGYVCTNGESDYIADFVEYEHWCEEYEER